MRTIDAPAKRGDILDRRGRVLATSVDADSIYAVPSEIDERRRRSSPTLCGALGDCTAEGARRRWPSGSASQQRVRVRAAAGVAGRGAPRRRRSTSTASASSRRAGASIPNKELAAHLLGYVGLDNDGLGGIEATYDSQIRGKAGTVLVQTDARRHAFSRVRAAADDRARPSS